MNDSDVTAGYKAIYELYGDDKSTEFDVYYGATENSSRCVLRKYDSTVDYVVYNGKSPNDKCGIYVRYRTETGDDGAVDPDKGAIVDIYAYVLGDKEVVSSGKKQWEDAGTDEFINVTEK